MDNMDNNYNISIFESEEDNLIPLKKLSTKEGFPANQDLPLVIYDANQKFSLFLKTQKFKIETELGHGFYMTELYICEYVDSEGYGPRTIYWAYVNDKMEKQIYALHKKSIELVYKL